MVTNKKAIDNATVYGI